MDINNPKKYIVTVSKKRKLSHKVYLVTLTFEKNSDFSFQAGQFVNVRVEDKIHRQYSIASSPYRKDEIDLLVDIAPGGPGSRFFERLREKEKIEISSAMGKFSLVQTIGTIVFLSAGTGVAPFISMIEYLLYHQYRNKDEQKREIYLYQSFRYEQDIFLQKYFSTLDKTYRNFHSTITLSRPSSSWKGCSGYVQTCIDKALLTKNDSHFYICGGNKMVEGVIAFLRENKVRDTQLHFELF